MSASHFPPSRRPGRRKPRSPKNYNRIRDILALLPETGLVSERQLARACGVSASQMSRIRRGECVPSCFFMWALAGALEARLGRAIDPRDLLNFDGDYPTICTRQFLGLPAEEA